MQYILLIHDEEQTWANYSEEEAGAVIGEYMKFGEHLNKNNLMLGGERLEPSNTATTVRVRDGEAILSDGPFAETKEVLGGFYMVEAEDLDHAIKLAQMIPAARTGSIEVRPVWVMDH